MGLELPPTTSPGSAPGLPLSDDVSGDALVNALIYYITSF